MSGIQCVYNSRRALYRVFVSPLERQDALLPRQLLPLLHARAVVPVQTPLHVDRQTRSFVVSSHVLARSPRDATPTPTVDDDERGFDRRYTTKEDVEKSGRDRLPQDHEITDPMIMLLEDGKFDGPVQTRQVMRRLEPTDSLRMVHPYVPARPKDSVAATLAICKVVNKQEEYERQRQMRDRRKASKATSAKTKEMELNWGIGDNDLATKLRQLGGFLKKGMKVEVILGCKKRAKKVDDDAAEDVLRRVKKGIEDLGAREHKAQDGQVNKTLRLYFEGSKQAQQQQEEQKKKKDESAEEETSS